MEKDLDCEFIRINYNGERFEEYVEIQWDIINRQDFKKIISTRI